nr:hypothetical protein ICEMyc226_00120 [Mycolicibacterium sp.]
MGAAWWVDCLIHYRSTLRTQNTFEAAQAVANQALELREHLAQITLEWEQLSDNWEGKAASAYLHAWNPGSSHVAPIGVVQNHWGLAPCCRHHGD